MSHGQGHGDISRQYQYTSSMIGTVPQSSVDMYIVILSLTLRSKMSYPLEFGFPWLLVFLFMFTNSSVPLAEISTYKLFSRKEAFYILSFTKAMVLEAEIRHKLVHLIAVTLLIPA